MKAETFAELVDSMNEALDHMRDKRSLRTTTSLRPPTPFGLKGGRSTSPIRRVLRVDPIAALRAD